MTTAGARRVACLAGASGLVGRELAQQLANHSSYSQVHSLVRRPAASATASKLVEHVVDFDALPELPGVDDVYIALGTTIKDAGSEQAFRRVDFDYVVNVARAALAAGAGRLGVVSALGADAASRVSTIASRGRCRTRSWRLATNRSSSRSLHSCSVTAKPWGKRCAVASVGRGACSVLSRG